MSGKQPQSLPSSQLLRLDQAGNPSWRFLSGRGSLSWHGVPPIHALPVRRPNASSAERHRGPVPVPVPFPLRPGSGSPSVRPLNQDEGNGKVGNIEPRSGGTGSGEPGKGVSTGVQENNEPSRGDNMYSVGPTTRRRSSLPG